MYTHGKYLIITAGLLFVLFTTSHCSYVERLRTAKYHKVFGGVKVVNMSSQNIVVRLSTEDWYKKKKKCSGQIFSFLCPTVYENNNYALVMTPQITIKANSSKVIPFPSTTDCWAGPETMGKLAKRSVQGMGYVEFTVIETFTQMQVANGTHTHTIN